MVRIEREELDTGSGSSSDLSSGKNGRPLLILDPADQPMAQVRVTPFKRLQVFAEVVSNSEGEADLDPSFEDGHLALLAPGHWPTLMEVSPGDGPLIVRLKGEGELSGKIHCTVRDLNPDHSCSAYVENEDRDGMNRIHNAAFRLPDLDDYWGGWQPLVVEADSGFRIRGLGKDRYSLEVDCGVVLSASAMGEPKLDLDMLQPSLKEMRIEVDGREASYHGRFTHLGQPLRTRTREGQLSLQFEGREGLVQAPIWIYAEGVFVAAVPLGALGLALDADGYPHPVRGRLRVPFQEFGPWEANLGAEHFGEKGELGDIEVDLGPYVVLKVVDEQGHAVPDAFAHAGRISLPTDANGETILAVEPGTAEVTVGAIGYQCVAEMRTFRGEGETHTVRLPPGQVLEVEVGGSHPQPHTLADLQLQTAGQPLLEPGWSTATASEIYKQLLLLRRRWGGPPRALPRNRGLQVFLTHRKMAIWGLRAGLAMSPALIDDGGVVVGAVDPVVLGPGERRRIRISVREDLDLFAGFVVDEWGQAIEHAQVRVSTETGWMGKGADEEGAFAFTTLLPVGEAQILAEGYETILLEDFHMPATGAPTFRLQKDRPVPVRVEDSFGNPVAGVELTTTKPYWGWTTDESGCALLEGLPALGSELEWRIGGASGFIHLVPGSQEVVIVVPSPGSVAVRFLCPEVSGDLWLRVELHRLEAGAPEPQGHVGSVSIRDGQECSLQLAATPGPYELTWAAYDRGEAVDRGQERLEVKEGKETILEVELKRLDT